MTDQRKEIYGEPIETDNSIRPEDGEQDVSQDAGVDYSEGK
jgi:hypothetical protein